MEEEKRLAAQGADKRTADFRPFFLAEHCVGDIRDGSPILQRRIQDCKTSACERWGIDLKLRQDWSVSITERGIWQIHLWKNQNQGKQKQLKNEHSPAPVCHGRLSKKEAAKVLD
jgi:hypothetical protein